MPSAAIMAVVFRAAPGLRDGIASFSIDHQSPGTSLLVLLLACLFLLWLVATNTWSRCSRLHLSLPLTPRRLWLVRMAAILFASLLPIVVTTLIFGVRIGSAGGWIAFDTAFGLPAFRMAAGVVLAAVLLQSPAPAQYRHSASVEYVMYCIGVLVVSMISIVAAFPALAGSVAIIVVAGALGCRLVLMLPPGFSIDLDPHVPLANWDDAAPPVSSPDSPASPATAAGVNGSVSEVFSASRWLLHRTIFRTTMNSLLGWLLMLSMLVAAAAVTAEFFDGKNAILPLILVMIWQLPVMQQAIARMDRLDPLPISRRLLFAHISVPMAGMVLAGVAVAHIGWRLSAHRPAQIRYSDGAVQVPFEYWRITGDALPPAIVAPWGESLTPKPLHLIRGGRYALYNPYETGSTTSDRFVDWQVSRAMAEVHRVPASRAMGRSGDPSQQHPSPVSNRCCFTPDQSRGQASDGRSRTAVVTLLLLMSFNTGLVAVWLQQFSSRVHRKLFKWMTIGFLVGLVAVVGALLILEMIGITRMWYTAAVLSIGVRQLSEIAPFPTLLLWVLVAVTGTISYLVVERQFMKIETPGRTILEPFAEDY
jgi:hypothetical protein